jgi:hypothetical protein
MYNNVEIYMVYCTGKQALRSKVQLGGHHIIHIAKTITHLRQLRIKFQGQKETNGFRLENLLE